MAALAVVAPVLHGDDDEGRELAPGVLRDGEIVEGVLEEIDAPRAVMQDEERSLGTVLVSGRHVDDDEPLLANGLGRIEGCVVTAEVFAVRQGHGEAEVLSFRIALVG